MLNREALSCPPPRQDKIVERVYGHYKILGYYGTRAVRSIIKISIS